MIDLAAFHSKQLPNVPIARFFNTKAYKEMHAVLKAKGLADSEIAVRSKPFRGHPGVAQVHRAVLVEYLRWANYSAYVNWVLKKIRED